MARPHQLGAIQQFIGDVEWGELDYLVIDFPPGTSDEPLTVAQSLPDIDGMVTSLQPQQVALLDSRKSITFSESLKVPVLGVVENMSGFTVNGTANPGTEVSIAAPGGKTLTTTADDGGKFSVTLDIFKEGGGKETAQEFGVPFLGALPFDPGFVRGGDDGVHRIVSEPEAHPLSPLQRLLKPSKTNFPTVRTVASKSFEGGHGRDTTDLEEVGTAKAGHGPHLRRRDHLHRDLRRFASCLPLRKMLTVAKRGRLQSRVYGGKLSRYRPKTNGPHHWKICVGV